MPPRSAPAIAVGSSGNQETETLRPVEKRHQVARLLWCSGQTKHHTGDKRHARLFSGRALSGVVKCKIGVL